MLTYCRLRFSRSEQKKANGASIFRGSGVESSSSSSRSFALPHLPLLLVSRTIETDPSQVNWNPIKLMIQLVRNSLPIVALPSARSTPLLPLQGTSRVKYVRSSAAKSFVGSLSATPALSLIFSADNDTCNYYIKSEDDLLLRQTVLRLDGLASTYRWSVDQRRRRSCDLAA